jgi:hypothetical protein
LRCRLFFRHGIVTMATRGDGLEHQRCALSGIAGLIAGALSRHSIGALVSAPAWLMTIICSLLAFALVHSVRTERGSACLPIALCTIAGTAFGFALPGSLAPIRSNVMTHAPAWPASNALFAALERLDAGPQDLLGKRISVSGAWHPPVAGSLGAVAQPVMTCCAADAVDVGFDVIPARPIHVAAGAQVRVSGVVRASLRDGETRYALTDADVSVLSARSSAAK